MEIKVGDTVAVSGRYGITVETVTKVTPTGRFSAGTMQFMPTGRMIGGDRYFGATARLATDDDVQAATRQTAHRKARNAARDLHDRLLGACSELTADDLTAIAVQLGTIIKSVPERPATMLRKS